MILGETRARTFRIYSIHGVGVAMKSQVYNFDFLISSLGLGKISSVPMSGEMT